MAKKFHNHKLHTSLQHREKEAKNHSTHKNICYTTYPGVNDLCARIDVAYVNKRLRVINSEAETQAIV